MVQLHVKRSDQDHFLLEVPAAALGRDALVLAVSVSNLRNRLLHVCEHGAALARRGPAPEPCDSDEEAGTGAEAGSASTAAGCTPADVIHTAGNHACSAEDALEPVSSAVPDSHAAQQLEQALADAKRLAHTARPCWQTEDQVGRGAAVTEAALAGALDAVRGAVLDAFPGGLPPWDPVRRGLEGDADAQGAAALEPGAAELWFAGRQLEAGAPLSARLGRNDKTRVVVRLQRRGGGAPMREPVVDEATHKAMLAWHFKKQEQQQKLAEDDGTAYYDSAWADPKALKTHFSGVSQVRLA